MLKSATPKKSTHRNKDTKADVSKTITADATSEGKKLGDAMSEKATTVPGVTTTAEPSVKDTVTKTTVTGIQHRRKRSSVLLWRLQTFLGETL